MQADRSQVKILLIEDDEDDCLLIRKLLAKATPTRFNLDWVKGYDEALEAILGTPFDACLLDYRLGDRDGLELLREATGKGCRIPVILLTGQGGYELDLRAMRAGAVDFLPKDEISTSLLDRSIRYAIDRRQKEEALKESQELFHQIFTQSLMPNLLFERGAGTIVDANPAACGFYGYSLQELKTKSDIDLLAPEENPQRLVEAAPGIRSPLLSRHRLSSGEIRDVEVHVSLVRFRSQELLFTVVLDVSERKRTERALDRSEAKYRELVANANSIILCFDANGNITFSNDFAQKFFGCMQEEILGRGVMGPIVPGMNSFDRGLAEMVQDVFQSPERHGSIENENVCGNGEKVWISWANKAIVDDKGKVCGVFCIGNDITERKKAEEALRKSENELRSLSSRLLTIQEEERKRIAGELHDSIGQTLVALKYGVEAILDARNWGDAQGAFKFLEQFVPTLQYSIDETRAIYMGLRPTMLDNMGILAALQWFCREFLNLYPKHHVELEMNIAEEEIPEPIKIAIFRISQEALNNVAKHSRAEWVDFSLLGKEDAIELTISDDGIGVDLDSLHSRSDFARSLGLVGMRERAELSGGTFSIESTPGEGTVVKAYWPIKGVRH